MDQITTNCCAKLVFLLFHHGPQINHPMIAQMIEETTIWELSMMLEAMTKEMVNGRILRSPSFELLYQGNKMMNYNKTLKDYGINSSTATRENPAVLYMTFKQSKA